MNSMNISTSYLQRENFFFFLLAGLGVGASQSLFLSVLSNTICTTILGAMEILYRWTSFEKVGELDPDFAFVLQFTFKVQVLQTSST